VQRFSRQYGVAPKQIAPDTLARLTAHSWPGNVRELQNVIERAFALSAADTISVEDLPPALAGVGFAAPTLAADGELPTLQQAERRLITEALRKSGGNKNEAARLLGIDRQRLYRKIEKYGL
jgi:DNA-binding NtrC family response regulator